MLRIQHPPWWMFLAAREAKLLCQFCLHCLRVFCLLVSDLNCHFDVAVLHLDRPAHVGMVFAEFDGCWEEESSRTSLSTDDHSALARLHKCTSLILDLCIFVIGHVTAIPFQTLQCNTSFYKHRNGYILYEMDHTIRLWNKIAISHDVVLHDIPLGLRTCSIPLSRLVLVVDISVLSHDTLFFLLYLKHVWFGTISFVLQDCIYQAHPLIETEAYVFYTVTKATRVTSMRYRM